MIFTAKLNNYKDIFTHMHTLPIYLTLYLGLIWGTA